MDLEHAWLRSMTPIVPILAIPTVNLFQRRSLPRDNNGRQAPQRVQSGRANRTAFLRILSQRLRLIASFSAMVVKRKVGGLPANFDFQWPTKAKLWCVWLFLAPKMAKQYKGGVNRTIFYHLITPHCDECNACRCGGVQPPFVAFCIFNAFK